MMEFRRKLFLRAKSKISSEIPKGQEEGKEKKLHLCWNLESLNWQVGKEREREREKGQPTQQMWWNY